MNMTSIRRPLAWVLIFLLSYGQALQAATLNLATTPLAATTTSVVRPNLMYVLDDSGSMAWDYTPDYINDATVTDPTNAGITPPGSAGDRGVATVSGGVITAISAIGGNIYEHGTPTVLIQGAGTGAAATVTLAADKTIASVNVSSGGTGYVAATTYVTFLGGLKTAAWGMCWGTTGTSNQGGTPKDTSAAPTCTTRSQMPYSTAKVNFQYYDPAVRYLPPLRADGTSYPNATAATAQTDGFAGTGSTNLTNAYQHEIWCSVATPSPTPSAANIATHTQCKENTDTTNNALYPNATYTFRKTYNGPAYYHTMEASEYCTSTDYTNCITRDEALAAVPAFVVGGVTYNVPSYYRWCAFYNPISKTFGGCQGRRDLDHYLPNYLGGWVSTGAAGVQSTASLVINATTAGQSLTSITVGGVNVVGGQTFTSTANGDQATVAQNICTAIQANTGGTGYSCAVTGSTVLIQAAAVGDAANGLPVLAVGPSAVAAVNATGEIRVTTATAGLTINSITIHGNELLSANVTADGDQGNTARMICEAINSGAQQGVYIARSGSQAGAAADTYAFGTCQSHADAYVQVKRVPADDTDNGQAIVISGPATATISSGSIQINSTAGATTISDVTKDGVSIFTAPALAIADGTQTTSIATSLAAKINGNGGCSATASGNLVTITGCTGVLAVTSGSTQATGTIKVTSTGHSYGADLGGIQVGATSLAGHITPTTLSNGTSVAANASALRAAINAGTGTHGFTAAVPVASGSDYNLTVTAPVGTAYNGQSFTFQPGTAVVAGAATSPIWNFSITNATKDDAIIDYIRCDPSDSVANDELYILSTDATTGSATTNNLEFTTALANGLNSSAINGYTYSCAYDSGTQNDQICNVTGPTGVSACTSDLSFTKDGTITTKNYSKLTAGSAGCSAITAPTWTFRLSDSVDNDTITSITCGGTNTITPNTVAAGNGNGDSRRGLLASGMNSNDTNGYTYSCSNDTSNNRVDCTVTGPTAAAACTNLQFTKSPGITLDFNNNVSQACPAITTGTSATWRFTIDNATSANKLFNSITCGGVNTITTNTVSTGTASNTTVARINNLKSTLEANDANGYNISCTTATSGTAQSDCTITGPAGANACQGTDTGDSNNCGVGALSFKYDGTLDGSTGIALSASGMTTPRTADYVRACVPASSNGSSGATAVDDYAPFLFTLSTFAGGAPSQGTTITPIASNDVGTIGTTTVAMANGTAPSVLTISTNATGTAPNVLTMGGGSNPNTATNHWTGTGIFKRVDVVSTNNSYSRASGRTDCAAATCTYTEELQNFANWYSYYRTRMLMMKSATTLAFTQLDGNYRVGFDNICQATGTTVDNPVAQFEGAGRTSWWTSLTNASPNCATPLRAETAKIGQYYARKLNATQADPMEYSCQQNYMLLVTDGYWNETESSAIKGVSGADIGNTDNALTTAARPYYDGAQASTSCPAVGGSRGSTAYSCRTLADIAFHYYSTDLRTNALGNATNTLLGRDVATNNVLTTADDKNQAQHMNFFAMGLGIDGKLGFNSDYQTSGIGDYAAIVAGTKDWPAVANLDPTGVDDLWHATVNGRGKYFSARNVPNVVAGLREALNKIGARVGSAAAAATSNLEPVAGDNFAYVASYTTLDWTGDLQSRSIDVLTGEVSSSTACTTAGSGCQWSAQAKLDNTTWSARRIFIKPTSGTSGDPLRGFNYDNLTGAEQAFFNPSTLSQYAALSISNASDITASNLVNFLRGNRGLEQDGDVSHAQIWRRRSHVLGDIVNTQPVFMKAPNALYADAGYSSFKSANASRQPVVFVSAQDGMLHAFNAHTSAVTVSGTAVQPGEEMWAFVPTQAMETMKVLGDVNYAHRYFVDGQITIADVDFGGGNWHTILVGGQGAGGRSYFALDVTDPTSPKYLWEFSDANLGNTFSNAAVSKLHSGEWAVMFSSGYNNTANGGDGIGHLFALNPETGAAKTGFPLSTGSGTGGSPSNLGKLALWADNPGVDNTAQYVYAGDTNGDLWRFDLDPSGTGHTGTAVFKLAHMEVSSIPLPITTRPELSSLTDGTRLIMVGTGKYLESSDLTNVDVQGFFVVKDTLGAANLGGASQETWNPATDTLPSDATQPMFLQRKLIADDENGNPIAQTDASGVTRNFRMVCAGAASTVTPSGTAPNLSYSCNNEDATSIDLSLHGGWYALFPDTGERMNVDPKLVRGTLVFATNIPAADSCTVGGRSWANFLDYQTGLAVAGQTFTSIKIPDSLVVGITVIRLQSGDYKAIATKSNYQQETLAVPIAASAPGLPSTPPANTFQSKRGLWREFEAY
ncbi:MAG: PilC/PilY family type IV pilus protein [Sulfuritalea sp.]|nr:PilC/PilY family type IV pilus protein [Sulfuritalea sp.]